MHRSLIAYPIIQFDEMALQYRHRFPKNTFACRKILFKTNHFLFHINSLLDARRV